MLGAERADRGPADAGDADDLALVVDPHGRLVRLSVERRQLHDLAVRLPEDRPELADLREVAGRIVGGGLRPSDDLTEVVDAGGKAVAPAERRERRHHAVPPREADAGGAGSPGDEGRAAPRLVQHDAAAGAGPAERAEAEREPEHPEHRVLHGGAAGHDGGAGHEAQVVDAGGRAVVAAERGAEVDERIGDRLLRVVPARRRDGRRDRQCGEQDRRRDASRYLGFHDGSFS